MTMIWTIVAFGVGVFCGWYLSPWIDDKITPDDEPANELKPVKPSTFWGW